MSIPPTDQELKDIVDGKGIDPSGTNIPLIQAMAKELLEARAHKTSEARPRA
jgi:hypothetical protein